MFPMKGLNRAPISLAALNRARRRIWTDMADMENSSGLSLAEAAQGVMAMAHFAGARHWVPATSGNFSVRMDGKLAALTATGADKAHLTEGEVIAAEITGPKHPRASAEAPLHLAR